MARCVNYETGETCPHFYKCEKQGEEVLVTVSKFKKLDQFCFYCKATPGVKKIAGMASFTGSTPRWCPLGGPQMNIARAWAIFADINSKEYTTEEKGQAVMLVCGAATHNSITKAMMLRVIWWLLNLAFDVPEGARGPEA